MNKKYSSPKLCIIHIVGAQHLLVDSIKVDSSTKVSNSEDIGFVKGNSRPNNHDVWDDDWSK